MKARLTITHAAFLLGLRERTVVMLANAGKIPALKIGKNYTFDEDELHAWIEMEAARQKHPASLTATPVVTKGILASREVTPEPPVQLVRGAKGRNRERLKESGARSN